MRATVVDRVDDLCGEIARSTVSVSQAGYNTTMDVLRAGRPAVVVPYADGGEDEQTRRADAHGRLGVCGPSPAAELTPARLVDEVVAAVAAPPPAVVLDLGGRERSTEIVAELVAARRRAVVHERPWLDPCSRPWTRPPLRSGVLPRRRRRVGRRRACGRCSTCSTDAGVTVDVAAIPRPSPRRAAGSWRASRSAGWCACTNTASPTRTTSRSVGSPSSGCRVAGPARRPTSARGGSCSRTRFGAPIEPVFTPPWNRCTADTADAALAAGHVVLSRDVSAGRLDRPGLAEVPVSIDWSSRRHTTPMGRADAIAADVAAGGPVGVMLHHAVMDADDRCHLAALLALVAASPMAIPTTVRALARGNQDLGAKPSQN